jgi:hypothetical protein
MNRFIRFSLVSLAILSAAGLPACERIEPNNDAPPAATTEPTAAKLRPLARLFFQDHEARTLKWADVGIMDSGQLSLGTLNDVEGFPTLDPTKQKLVQMDRVDNKLLVGVRDDDEGEFGSGWVMLGTGVRYIDHGDHGHWSYRRKPVVLCSRIDAEQGNPAHLYVYDEKFYLANDQKNGYTRFNPAEFPRVPDPQAAAKARFLPGGGNHITLAVVEDKVGYGCWIDGGGPNKGRVDVTPIHSTGEPRVAYSFSLPSGVIHGATACAGKVFFAPADGIYWTEADTEVKLKPDQVVVRHISLGQDGDRPLRTGAFATHGRFVLCVTGKAEESKLVLLDAAASDPQPIFIPLTGQENLKPLTPEIVLVGGKKPFALVFHDHDKAAEATDRLDVIDLDPNKDGDYSDAKILKSLEVGPSAVDGHYGHHGVAFDANGEFAFFTNPGEGTIAVFDLKKLEIVATFKVGGMPTAIVVHGGLETED